MKSRGQSQYISPDIALRLLIRFKYRTGQRHSWAEVEREIKKSGHQYSFLVDRKKLRFWEIGRTLLNKRAYESVCHFINTKEFVAIVPEAVAYIDQYKYARDTGAALKRFYDYRISKDNQDVLETLKGKSGIYLSGTHSVGSIVGYDKAHSKGVTQNWLYIEPVEDCEFALIHTIAVDVVMCSKIDSTEIYSGFLFLHENEDTKKTDIILHIWNRFSKKHYKLKFDFQDWYPHRAWSLLSSSRRHYPDGPPYFEGQEGYKYFISDKEVEEKFVQEDRTLRMNGDSSKLYFYRYSKKKVLQDRSDIADQKGSATSLHDKFPRLFDKMFLSVVPENDK